MEGAAEHAAGKRENWQRVSDYWNLGSERTRNRPTTDDRRATPCIVCDSRFFLQTSPLSQLYSGYMHVDHLSQQKVEHALSSAQPPLRAPPAALHSKLHNPVFPTHHKPTAPARATLLCRSGGEPTASPTHRPPAVGLRKLHSCAEKKNEVDRFVLPVGRQDKHFFTSAGLTCFTPCGYLIRAPRTYLIREDYLGFFSLSHATTHNKSLGLSRALSPHPPTCGRSPRLWVPCPTPLSLVMHSLPARPPEMPRLDLGCPSYLVSGRMTLICSMGFR